jgi:hypothetical protein
MASKKVNKKKPQKEIIIDDIRNILCNTDQETLFGDSVNYGSLEELFKLFLEKSGYIIRKPWDSKYTAKKESDLISIFYGLLDKYNPGMVRPSNDSTKGKDITLAKHLVNNRMKALGCSKEASLIICTKMIETLIKYEHYYNLSYPIKGFNVFNKLSIDWIFTKTDMIIKNPDTYAIDTKFFHDEEKGMELLVEEYGEDYFSFELKGD